MPIQAARQTLREEGDDVDAKVIPSTITKREKWKYISDNMKYKLFYLLNWKIIAP
jgi:hypothetical protein